MLKKTRRIKITIKTKRLVSVCRTSGQSTGNVEHAPALCPTCRQPVAQLSATENSALTAEAQTQINKLLTGKNFDN